MLVSDLAQPIGCEGAAVQTEAQTPVGLATARGARQCRRNCVIYHFSASIREPQRKQFKGITMNCWLCLLLKVKGRAVAGKDKLIGR